MNQDTGEIHHFADRLALAAAGVVQPPPTFQKMISGYPPIIERLEAKALGKCNYDADAVAAQMLAEKEHGKLIELRGDPNPDCPECRGKGMAGGGLGTDGKAHPCRCCAMPLHWCNTHNRPATHLVERLGQDRGKPCCDPKLGGVAMPCFTVELTGIAELV